MASLIDNPVRVFIVGLTLVGLVLAAWLLTGRVDPVGLIALLLRWIHVVSAMVWVGFIFFVNFIQLPVLQGASETSGSVILRWIVPQVAAGFRYASHLTVLSGALLLIPTGYFLVPPLRSWMLGAGALGGLLMWTFVNFAIWPSLKIVLGHAASGTHAQFRARQTVKRYARLNLLLALPVTFLMLAAAHLS